MNMPIGSGLPALLVILCASHGLGQGKADTYTEKGRLRHKLELFRGHNGPEGREGQLWTIEPAGTWRVSQLNKGKEAKPLRHGTLTPKQLAALANHLAVQGLVKLPKEFGSFL